MSSAIHYWLGYSYSSIRSHTACLFDCRPVWLYTVWLYTVWLYTVWLYTYLTVYLFDCILFDCIPVWLPRSTFCRRKSDTAGFNPTRKSKVVDYQHQERCPQIAEVLRILWRLQWQLRGTAQEQCYLTLTFVIRERIEMSLEIWRDYGGWLKTSRNSWEPGRHQYLGTIIYQDGGCSKEGELRISKAWNTLTSYVIKNTS